MTTRRREQPLNTEPPRASRIAAKVADEIQSATLGMDKSPVFSTLLIFWPYGKSGHAADIAAITEFGPSLSSAANLL
jgi:hypothetical protein